MEKVAEKRVARTPRMMPTSFEIYHGMKKKNQILLFIYFKISKIWVWGIY